MKVQFLAVGIIVYLVPVVIQRVEEVEEVYEQTAITLGASIWQRIIYVFIPSVMSKIMVDIKVLVAISWTYIIYAEMVNATAGVGKLAYLAQRQSRYDKMYAIMLIIIAVGFLQDKLFEFLDKKLFPYKYL
jgi:NitT/TauT family transport system permease protein